jgi:cell wall-associated NlpC family hydrolase
MLPLWVKEYVGIPFVPYGRDKRGCDCYGIVRLVLIEQFDITLPLYDYTFGDQENEAAALNKELPTLAVQKATGDTKVGDIVLMRYMGMPSHIGLFIGDDCILHTTAKRFSVVDPIGSTLIKSRIVGVYRLCQLE